MTQPQNEAVTLASVNPADGQVVGVVPVTPVDEIAGVVNRARRVQGAWAALGAQERAGLVGDAAAVFVERADELGELLTREMGKPLARGVGEVRSVGKGMPRELEEMVGAFEPEVHEDSRTHSIVYHDPLGVCAAITPWNFPMSMPHWMCLPALMAGNAVVLKPSEETPLTAQAYVDILNQVLPEGVLQIVHGAEDQGRALVDSDVDLIAFTGSREVGKLILRAASRGLKRVILELGGKDPLIVLDDADLEKAADFAARNSFENAGQVCVSTERIFVPESVADRFVDLLVERTRQVRVGSGLDEGTEVGPMVNETQRDHVLSQVEQAVSAGARVVAGGDGHQGNFVVPTVLMDVTEGMEIACQETFGPVAAVTVVSDEEDALRRANDSPFGLGAVVFGQDEERAMGVARRLSAGMVGINRSAGGATGTPWVGARESGYGFHHSVEGHRQFTQVRLVSRSKS
jgi:succinate-semialdehyde dehydrogenase/glutarate-semialdehyde dehydrogenase